MLTERGKKVREISLTASVNAPGEKWCVNDRRNGVEGQVQVVFEDKIITTS